MVLVGAADIAQETTVLRTEVNRFLVAIRTDATERRQFERFQLQSASAVMRLAGSGPVRITVENLSEGGMAFQCDLAMTLGAEVVIEFSKVAGQLGARVIRDNGRGRYSVEFHSDAATRLRALEALETFAGERAAA